MRLFLEFEFRWVFAFVTEVVVGVAVVVAAAVIVVGLVVVAARDVAPVRQKC